MSHKVPNYVTGQMTTDLETPSPVQLTTTEGGDGAVLRGVGTAGAGGLSTTTTTTAAAGYCRQAVFADRASFVRLWRPFLHGEREGGSVVWADEHNLRLYREIFDSYTRGEKAGAAVFWYPEGSHIPKGVVMVGEDGQGRAWHTDARMNGRRLATFWGIYVDPEFRGQHVGLQMEKFGRPFMVQMGFTDLVTSVRADNPLGKANWRNWDEFSGVREVESLILVDLTSKEG